jgi:hypothetical protein
MTYTLTSEILRDIVETGQAALKGDSNDAEYDALYEIVTYLEGLLAESAPAPPR